MTNSDREKLMSIDHVIELNDLDYYLLSQLAIETAENERQRPRIKLPSFKQFIRRRLNQTD